MEETMKCACGGDIQDGVCTSCGAVADATSTEEMGSNIEASDEVTMDAPAEEEVA